MTERSEILRRLAEYHEPVEPLLDELRQFGWDTEREHFIMSRNHINAILARFIAGDLTAEEVTGWAECFEAREDVGFEHCGANLQEIVFRLANPEINEPITRELAMTVQNEMQT